MVGGMSEKISGAIGALGGIHALVAGLGVTRQAVYIWQNRGSFPGHIYFAMCDLAAERGVELDPALFHFDRKPRTRKVRDATTTQDG